MQTRAIGRHHVGAIGFGGAPISLRPDRPGDDQGVAVIQAALDAGVTLFDTADVYTPAGTGRGHSERLIARALRERGLSADASDGRVVVATKGGKYWDAAGEVRIDASPAALLKACDASLEALGADTISLYQLHALDPDVPIEESVGALAELRRLGKIEQIGLSNVDVSELDRARSVADIVSVQNHYSPALGIEDPVLDRCEELGIAFMPWGPLTGFRGRDTEPVSAAVGRFKRAAESLQVSVVRLVLAWELARSPVMLPIPGATRIESVLDSVAAAGETLDPTVVEWLSGAGPQPSALQN